VVSVMSEKLLPCPFCGGEARTFEYDGANQATCGGKHIDCAGTDVVAPVAMWNRRTPAPEGEAWRTVPVEPTDAMIEAANALWGEGTGVNYVQLEPEDFYAAMLAASPVVPVGREEIAAIIHDIVDSDLDGNLVHVGKAADAILAALRPTDTGWRDIATAPRDGRVVLVFSAARCVWSVVSAQWRQDWPNGGWDTISKHTTPIVPTHWMPLPAAPTDTGRE
jgi:hypothetical protein